MDPLTRETLIELSTSEDAPCASIYLPTHRGGREVRQDPIRFRNLLRRCEESLADEGAEASPLLSPAYRLAEDELFWRHQGDGLAVFASPTAFHSFRLPVRVPELAVVNARYYLKPLLPLVADDERFYVLALSRSRVRFLEAWRYQVHEVDLPPVLPSSLQDVVGRDREQGTVQLHSETPRTGGGRRVAMFHGHSTGDDLEDREVRTFLQAVDRGVRELVPDRRAPLVLAGVATLTAAFVKLSKYPNVLATTVEGNADHLTPEELHEMAREVVRPLFEADRRAAAGRYRDAAGTGLASADLRTVVVAAHDGRIDSLFLPRGRQVWGVWDEDARRVEERGERREGDEDLLDVAALETFVHNGRIYSVPAPEVPGGGEVAAVFRY